MTDKALTATTTSNSGNSGSNGSNSNGGSQNPATGANDIVGVAAALVVITGVSAAAISPEEGLRPSSLPLHRAATVQVNPRSNGRGFLRIEKVCHGRF